MEDCLSGADGSTAHSDPKTIHSRLDEVIGLFSGDDVASDEIHAGIVLFDVLDYLDLVGGVSLWKIESQRDTSNGGSDL